MSRSAIEQEIKDLEKRLALEDEIAPACGPMAEDEDGLGNEIAALEEEIEQAEMRSASHKSKSVVFDDVDQELADLYNEINAEDQSVIEEGAEGKSGFFSGDENQNVTGPSAAPEAALLASRKARQARNRKAELTNSEEPHGKGALWQDKDVVEMEMGVDDLGEDTLDAVSESTEFSDSEFIYASNLKEASERLDRVAQELEARGGNWKKIAFRVDKIADAIDGERKGVVAKIAAKRMAARRAGK